MYFITTLSPKKNSDIFTVFTVDTTQLCNNMFSTCLAVIFAKILGFAVYIFSTSSWALLSLSCHFKFGFRVSLVTCGSESNVKSFALKTIPKTVLEDSEDRRHSITGENRHS